jgi:hypothetical protein
MPASGKGETKRDASKYRKRWPTIKMQIEFYKTTHSYRKMIDIF